MIMDQLLTTDVLVDAKQIGKLIGLPETSVRRLAREGRLPVFHAGRLMRFSPREVLEYMKNNNHKEDAL